MKLANNELIWKGRTEELRKLLEETGTAIRRRVKVAFLDTEKCAKVGPDGIWQVELGPFESNRTGEI